jgi:hypothetical protein
MTTATIDKSELFIRQWMTEGTLPASSATWGDILTFHTGRPHDPTWTPDPEAKKQLTKDVESLVMRTYARLGCKKPREVRPEVYAQSLYNEDYTTVIGVRYLDIRLGYKPYKAQLHRSYSGFKVTREHRFDAGPFGNVEQFAFYSSPAIAFAAIFLRKERYTTYQDAYDLMAAQPEAAEFKV